MLTLVSLCSLSGAGLAQGGLAPANLAVHQANRAGSPGPSRGGSRSSQEVKSLGVGVLNSEIRIDGRLDEPVWARGDAIENLTMVEPTEGGTPTMRTAVRVLANRRDIVFGIQCDDPDPADIVSYTKQRDSDMSAEDHVENDNHASLDVTQRLGPKLLSSASVNTDFAEIEADTSQTNLTRFELYFPEKRTFFLEGADIFQFGPGGTDVVPFFSRTIGLVDGQQVPILAGLSS
jgi:hypothetical protein